MRVVGGIYRGGNLTSPTAAFVRPTTDKVKEAVFNILASVIDGARFLDLFGGSGGIGIEAASRGAAVTITDSSRESCRLIQSNLDKFGIQAPVLYGDYRVILRRLAESGEKFDLIYIDPPYATDYDVRALGLIEEYGLLGEKGMCVVEHSGKTDLTARAKSFAIRDERRYGGCRIAFVGKEDKP